MTVGSMEFFSAKGCQAFLKLFGDGFLPKQMKKTAHYDNKRKNMITKAISARWQCYHP